MELKLSLLRYCLVASAIALLGAFLLTFGAMIAAHLTNFIELPHESEGRITELDLIVYVGIAPLLQTLLLIAGLHVLLFLRIPSLLACAILACTLSWWHSFFEPIRLFALVCPYFVYCYVYLQWRRHSFRYGWAAAAITHAAVNLMILLTGLGIL